MKQVYVLRSACKKFTKIGITSNLSCRVDNLCFSERRKYYLVYNTPDIEDGAAQDLELKIINNFSTDKVRGREWLSTHPLDVIKYITSIIRFHKTKDLYFHDLSDFPCWLGSNGKYNQLPYMQSNGVRIDVNYIAHIKLIYNSQFITLCFCNVGDANNFAAKYKHNLEVTPLITELLFNKTYIEWYSERAQARNYILI